MKTFNETVIQTDDVNLHGLGYSENFVAFVEQNLLDVKYYFFLQRDFFQLFFDHRN